MRRVCVFCGSKCGNGSQYTEAARNFAECLVRRGLGLVYGGGDIGLMGILADTMLPLGGEVIGVIPRLLEAKELAHRGITELHVVESMHTRKALMADKADAFVALPGGFGTADELFEILTWRQLHIHDKPIGILNVAGFFDPFLAWLDRMVEEGFLSPKNRRMLLVETRGENLLARLEL
ncbi:MAG TPA: TIGR00730 family Rossman fold protein [Gemmataceae bacterium]|jgi:hypothetical protein|nr:TIGR00730 family Rossman fold protein [Gemmataceae bacterium]